MCYVLFIQTTATWPSTLALPTLTYGSPRATGGRSIWSPGPAPSRPTSPASTTPGRCCACRASLTASTTGSWRCPNRGPTWAWRTQTSRGRRRASAAWWGWTSCPGACSWTSGSWARWHAGCKESVAGQLQMNAQPLRIGMLLDYEAGTLTYYGEGQVRLHAFTASLHKRCSRPAGSGRASPLRSVNREHELIWSWGNRCIPTVAEPETRGLPSPSFYSWCFWTVVRNRRAQDSVWDGSVLICGELCKGRNILDTSTWMQMLIYVTTKPVIRVNFVKLKIYNK